MRFKLMTSVALSELCAALSIAVTGDGSAEIRGVCQLDSASDGDLCFAKNSADVSAPSGTILISDSLFENSGILTPEPRLTFILALGYLEKSVGFKSRFSGRAIDATVELGPNVVIEDGVVIGPHSKIGANTVIKQQTRIGARCVIGPNCSLGYDGFGYERDEAGNPVKFPHLGGVQIGSDVEIGAGTCIDRGTLSDTIIENQVKIDNLVHIAHNCVVGEAAFITACAELSGGVRVGKRAWIAPNCSILQKLEIGDDALVGIGAVALRSVPPSTQVVGNPARRIPRRT